MTEHRFQTPSPVDLFVESPKGTVEVAATETATTTVVVNGRHADQVLVQQDGQQVSVVVPRLRGTFLGADTRFDIRVELPASSSTTIRTGSADIGLTGSYDTVHLKSGSGRVRVDTVTGVLSAQTGSGDIDVDRVSGPLKIKSGSGDVVLGETSGSTAVSTGSGGVRVRDNTGTTVVKTGSGDLEVLQSTGEVSLSTGSGGLVVARAPKGRLNVKGASGSVRIGVPAGVPVWTDITTVTGAIRSDLPSAGEPQDGADHLEVRARTVSGDVVLTQA